MCCSICFVDKWLKCRRDIKCGREKGWRRTYNTEARIKIPFVVDYGYECPNIFKWMNVSQRTGHYKCFINCMLPGLYGCAVFHCSKLWFLVAIQLVFDFWKFHRSKATTKAIQRANSIDFLKAW